MKFETSREILITVNVEDYKPYRKSPDPLSPDEPEEIEIFAHAMIHNGNRIFKIQLSNLEIEALGLEQEAIEECKRDRLSAKIDRILDEKPVPDLLINRLKESIKDLEAK